MSQQQTKNCITLRGSAQIICEYLKFAINSVLFQRGLYPPESFKAEQQYGMTLLISEDPQIKNFLSNLLSQSEEWIVTKKVDKLSLIILNVANKEVLECWDFNVQYEDGDIELSKEKNETVGSKDLKKIKQEIRDVMLQVAATISFLPLLDCRCSFDVLVHAKTDCDVPEKWSEAEPVNITNAQNVQLKSYSTSLHKMETVKMMHYDKNVQIDIKVAVPEYYISHMLAIPLRGRQVSNKAFSTVIRLDILCYDVMGVDDHIPYFCENFFRLLNSTNEQQTTKFNEKINTRHISLVTTPNHPNPLPPPL